MTKSKFIVFNPMTRELMFKETKEGSSPIVIDMGVGVSVPNSDIYNMVYMEKTNMCTEKDLELSTDIIITAHDTKEPAELAFTVLTHTPLHNTKLGKSINDENHQYHDIGKDVKIITIPRGQMFKMFHGELGDLVTNIINLPVNHLNTFTGENYIVYRSNKYELDCPYDIERLFTSLTDDKNYNIGVEDLGDGKTTIKFNAYNDPAKPMIIEKVADCSMSYVEDTLNYIQDSTTRGMVSRILSSDDMIIPYAKFMKCVADTYRVQKDTPNDTVTFMLTIGRLSYVVVVSDENGKPKVSVNFWNNKQSDNAELMLIGEAIIKVVTDDIQCFMTKYQSDKLRIHKLTPTAKLPTGAYGAPSGLDLYSDEDIIIKPGEFYTVSTGLRMIIPDGYEIQIRPKSGLAAKYGVTVLNTPGTIDNDYRGEIKVILINHGSTEYHVEKGSKIAQMVMVNLQPYPESDIVELNEDEFNDINYSNKTDRDNGGFGSSGLK